MSLASWPHRCTAKTKSQGPVTPAEEDTDDFEVPDTAGDAPAPSPDVIGDGSTICLERGAVCYDLTEAQMEALANYDNGGKRVVCDSTCLDSGINNLHCNCEGASRFSFAFPTPVPRSLTAQGERQAHVPTCCRFRPPGYLRPFFLV